MRVQSSYLVGRARVSASRLRRRDASQLIEQVEDERQVRRLNRLGFGRRRDCDADTIRVQSVHPASEQLAYPWATLCPETWLVDEEGFLLHTVSGDHQHLHVVDARGGKKYLGTRA